MNINNQEIKKEFIDVFNKAGHRLYICSICNKMMASGYMHIETNKSYCGLKCLHGAYDNDEDIYELFEYKILECI